MNQPSVEDQALYLQSAEVHAAVHTVKNIAIRYRNAELSNEELLATLIGFFANYDRLRTSQVEQLRGDLIDALRWSVRPTKVGPAS